MTKDTILCDSCKKPRQIFLVNIIPATLPRLFEINKYRVNSKTSFFDIKENHLQYVYSSSKSISTSINIQNVNNNAGNGTWICSKEIFNYI